MSNKKLSEAAQIAITRMHQILGMSTEQERFAWRAMSPRMRRHWLFDAGVRPSICIAPLAWDELTPYTREKLVNFSTGINTGLNHNTAEHHFGKTRAQYKAERTERN